MVPLLLRAKWFDGLQIHRQDIMKKIKLSLLVCLFSSAVWTKTNPSISNRPTSWNKIKHVVIILLENTSADEAVKQPFLKSLINRGGYLSQYYAITHPSQPNYLALAGGSTFKITDDSNYNISAKHIGNLFEAKGYSWKSYAEAYPEHCYLGASKDTYYRKHVPFLSFKNVQTKPNECAKIVQGKQFFIDLAANQLPTYSFYIPDINNDGHDKGAAFADRWLSNTFGATFDNQKVISDTLFIVTFDEDDGRSKNNVYTIFLGAGVKKNTKSAVNYNHYSLLKTIEVIFELGTLGMNDQSATVISDIWLP